MRPAGRSAAALTAIALSAVLSGCGTHYPADAQGTLERAEGGVLKVGIADNPPWTETGADGPSGREVELVEDYADALDAQIEWTEGSESVLAEQMAHDELDLVIAGLDSDAPWTSDMALTRPYAEAPDPHGGTQQKVMAVRPGENALQVSLERHLAEAGGEL